MKIFRCSVSLMKTVRAIALFEMLFCVAVIIPITIFMLDVCFAGKFGLSVEFSFGVSRKVQLSIWLGFWTLVLGKFILDWFLYRGAYKESVDSCQIWIAVTGTVLMSVYLWSAFSLNIFWSFDESLTLLSVNLLIGVIKGLELAIVYKFMRDLRKQSDIQYLSTRVTAPVSITDFGFNHLHQPIGPRHFSLDEMREINDETVSNICANCESHKIESSRL